MNERRLYREALFQYGEEAQIGMLGEESSELSAEISRFFRGRSDKSDIAEEMADVEIMLKQVRLVIGDDVVDKEKLEKLERLKRRLEESENE